MTQQNNTPPRLDWKTQSYILGAALGAVMGFLSAYLFAREAEHNAEEEADERPKIPPSALLGLALSALSLVRQIAEASKKEKKK